MRIFGEDSANTVEKLEKIRQKLNKKGDISFKDADFAIKIKTKNRRAHDNEPLRFLYTDILKKLKRKEEGNFICAIPFVNPFFSPIVRECYRHLDAKDLVKRILVSLPENYHDKYPSFPTREWNFETCGGIRRVGISNVLRIPVEFPSWTFFYHNVFYQYSREEEMKDMSEKEPPSTLLKEAATVALLKKLEAPVALFSYHHPEIPSSLIDKGQKDLVIPGEMRDVLSIINTTRDEVDIVSLWEKNFGRLRKTIKISEAEALAEIVLAESKYIKRIKTEKQDLDDEFLEIAR